MPDNLGEQGTFNSAVQWLQKLDEIERSIDVAFVTNDYIMQFRVLNVYWSVLCEWMSDEKEKGKKSEAELHEDIREEAIKTNRLIIEAKNSGQTSIASAKLEVYMEWNIMLKKLINKKGLRMPKKDDPRFALK